MTVAFTAYLIPQTSKSLYNKFTVYIATTLLFLHDQIFVGGFVLSPSSLPGLNFQHRVQREDEDHGIDLKKCTCAHYQLL